MFVIYVSNLITAKFFLFFKYQFTTDTQNIFQLNQSAFEYVLSWTVTPLQRCRGGCEWFDRHKKYVGEACLHFYLEVNTERLLSVFTDKSLKN